MGNKSCLDCFKTKPSMKNTPPDTEMRELASRQEIQVNIPIKNPSSRNIPLPFNFKIDFDEIKKFIEKIPLNLESSVEITLNRHSKKRALPLKLEIRKGMQRRVSKEDEIPEEKDEENSVQMRKPHLKNHKKENKVSKYKPLKKQKMDSPLESNSALQNLRTYSFSPYIDNEILLYANNVELDTAESLWALNHNNLYQHINLKDFEVLDLNLKNSFKLQHKILLQFFEISIFDFPPENPLSLAGLYSQVLIHEKLSKLKYFHKFVCKLTSTYTIDASENFPKPMYDFKAVKLQEFGLCSMADLLEKGFIFPPNQILSFLKNISGLCEKSEALGIANRKLIPSNFMLAEGLSDFRIFDYSLACDIGHEKTTKLKNWINEFEDFWAPEISEVVSCDLVIPFNPFQADVYSLGLTLLCMMGVKKEEFGLYKAKEAALEKKLKNLEDDGYKEVVKFVRNMLILKPDVRSNFKSLHESLSNYKIKDSFIGNMEIIDKIRTQEKVKDMNFYEKLGDLMYLIHGEWQCLSAYEEALKLLKESFLSTKELSLVEIRLNEKIGKVFYEIGDFTSSIASFHRIAEIQKQILNENQSLENIRILILIAQLRGMQTNYNISARLFVEAYTQSLDLFENNQNKLEFAFIYKGFGLMLLNVHGFEEIAIKYLHKGLEIVIGIEGIKSHLYYIFLDLIGESFESVKDIQNASKTFQKIVDESRVVYGKIHPLLSKMFLKLAYAYYHEDEYLKAIMIYKRALKLQLKIFGKKSIEVAVTKMQLSKSYLNIQEWKKPLKLLEERYFIFYFDFFLIL